MASTGLPPPPINDAPGSFTWLEWYRQLRNYVSTSGSVPWYIINFAGSNITDIATRLHNQLQGLQGGTAGEFYHLTAAQYAALGGGGSGTVTSIATTSPILGGTITTTGTISHSTADGDLHVPATGTTNNGKVLTAGATAGSLSWQTPSSGGTTEAFIARTNTKTMTSNTSLQALFSGVTGATNGALTVDASTTYFFEAQFSVTSMSATSGNFGFSIVGAGTATFTSAAWQAIGGDATTLATAAARGGAFVSAAGQTGNILTAATGTGAVAYIKGIFRINAGGTIIPSIQLTTAAAAVIGTNSWFKCYAVGSDTVNTSGSWS